MNLNWLEWVLPALLAVALLAGGLAAGWGGCLLWQRRRELNALRELVTQLHLKRVFAEAGPVSQGPESAVDDPLRCRSAVADARGQVREALAELRPGSVKLAAVLVDMEAACAAYLRQVGADPGAYASRLPALRLELHTGLRRLCSLREDLEYLAPGQRGTVRSGERAAAAARVTDQLARRRAAAGVPASSRHRADPAAAAGSAAAPATAAPAQGGRRTLAGQRPAPVSSAAPVAAPAPAAAGRSSINKGNRNRRRQKVH